MQRREHRSAQAEASVSASSCPSCRADALEEAGLGSAPRGL